MQLRSAVSLHAAYKVSLNGIENGKVTKNVFVHPVPEK
jgi:hypothetical protein